MNSLAGAGRLRLLLLIKLERPMSFEFFLRIVGAFVFFLGGIYLGAVIADLSGGNAQLFSITLGLLGALVGLILTPFITTRPLRALRLFIGRISTQTFLAGLIGMTVGLLFAALLAFPLSLLPSPFGEILPLVGAFLFAYLGVIAFVMRQQDILSLFQSLIPSRGIDDKGTHDLGSRSILLDTSVIIDGRIADIARTGFLPGSLLIPRFILNELQYIADSPESLRRQRGRRGLEVLSDLQKDPLIPVRISDIDVEGTRAVDDKLIVLARQLKSPILTNDYNLNRVAELQGVMILNVNELANAVKAVFLPGEGLSVEIIQEGREQGQGVGYLEDGTMVVVEGGSGYIGKEVDAVVTKVLQTAAGRMIFARPEENGRPVRG
jgi:uncharacterized protein YacL